MNDLEELKKLYPFIDDKRDYREDLIKILIEQKKEIDKLKKQVKMLIENGQV